MRPDVREYGIEHLAECGLPQSLSVHRRRHCDVRRVEPLQLRAGVLLAQRHARVFRLDPRPEFWLSGLCAGIAGGGFASFGCVSDSVTSLASSLASGAVQVAPAMISTTAKDGACRSPDLDEARHGLVWQNAIKTKAALCHFTPYPLSGLKRSRVSPGALCRAIRNHLKRRQVKKVRAPARAVWILFIARYDRRHSFCAPLN